MQNRICIYIYIYITYKKEPKEYNKQGTNTINPNKRGNNTVQQKDINWSNLILGNEALTHMKTNTIIEVFTPKTTLKSKPFNEGRSNIVSLITL